MDIEKDEIVVPVEEPKVEEPKAEEPIVEEPKVEEPKVEEPKVEEPKVEEPKVEEPKVEEPKVEEPKVEEPKEAEPKETEPKDTENKVKYTRSEKRTQSLMKKLKKLEEKMIKDPPKTKLGKLILMTKLQRLENIVDKRLLQNKIEIIQLAETKQTDKDFAEAQNSVLKNKTD